MKKLIGFGFIVCGVMCGQSANLNTTITSGSITATVQKFQFQPNPSGPILANVSVCASSANDKAEAVDISISYQLFDGNISIKSATAQFPSVNRENPVCENFWLGQGRLLSVSFQEKLAPVVMSGFENPPFMK